MLNNTQKQLLAAAMEYLFEDIAGCNDKKLVISALGALQDEEEYQRHKQSFKEKDILDTVDQLRAIYQHPCPQNRSTGSPYVGQEPGLAVWRDPVTHQICKEPIGLLSLTAQNDQTAEGVTKRDVVEHLDSLAAKYLVHAQQAVIKDQETTITRLKDKSNVEEEIEEEGEEVEEGGSSSQGDHRPGFFNSTEQDLLAKAQAHLDQREHQAALPHLNQLIDKTPQHAQYRYLRGRSLAILGRREEALGDFNLAVRYAPNHAQTWVERGFTRENLEDIHGAIQDYSRALALNSQHAFALCQRGGLRMRIGEQTAGEQDFLASLKINPNDPNTYRNRGEQALFAGRWPQAIADFDEALRLRPNWDAVKAMQTEAQAKLDNAPPTNTSARRCLLS